MFDFDDDGDTDIFDYIVFDWITSPVEIDPGPININRYSRNDRLFAWILGFFLVLTGIGIYWLES